MAYNIERCGSAVWGYRADNVGRRMVHGDAVGVRGRIGEEEGIARG